MKQSFSMFEQRGIIGIYRYYILTFTVYIKTFNNNIAHIKIFIIYKFFIRNTMANLTAAALANRNKKHFLGVPAPLGYVAGVGRGYV